ncbi:sensor histidine kinase [Thalassotalea ganghwensis]
MRSQFIRIYLLIFALVCLLLYSFNEIYQQMSSKEYYSSINQLFTQKIQRQQQPLFSEVAKDTLALPASLESKLAAGEIIALELTPGLLTYYQQQQGQLLSYGPVPAEQTEDGIKSYFVILFYSALALLFLLLLKPLFNDLLQLQKAAQRFGKTPQVIPLDIRRRSSIYPLAQSFQKMSRQIVDLLTMNRDLSRTIAHELRTPLTRMRFVNEALKTSIPENYHKRLEQDIDEIDQLVSAYLNFAKLENKDDIFQKRYRSISPLMAKLEQKYQLFSEEVTLNFSYRDDKCAFDANHLSIAIQNLISNAMRYAESTINVSIEVKRRYCKLTISDDGPGLPKDKLDLFDAFVRKKSKSSDKGFGLGLYIARRVAILHSGDLRVGNDPDLGGARFTLLWPNEKH